MVLIKIPFCNIPVWAAFGGIGQRYERYSQRYRRRRVYVIEIKGW